MTHADTIWINGAILTMDPSNPQAEAMAARDGRLIAVGKTQDILNLAGPNTRIHDLHGKFTLPGLVESHTHALWGACRTLFDIYVGFNASVTDLLAATKERCARNAPTDIVYGGPWRPNMRDEMGSNPAALLDAISTEHSIVLHDASQHILWCNTRALRRAGIAPDAADIAGGVIERDPATGAPNGILAETAGASFCNVPTPNYPPPWTKLCAISTASASPPSKNPWPLKKNSKLTPKVTDVVR